MRILVVTPVENSMDAGLIKAGGFILKNPKCVNIILAVIVLFLSHDRKKYSQLGESDGLSMLVYGLILKLIVIW